LGDLPGLLNGGRLVVILSSGLVVATKQPTSQLEVGLYLSTQQEEFGVALSVGSDEPGEVKAGGDRPSLAVAAIPRLAGLPVLVHLRRDFLACDKALRALITVKQVWTHFTDTNHLAYLLVFLL